jgi:hypothetical protein
MDPFEALPLELAVCVLLQLERDPARLARHLRAPLLVSKRWNAVASQPEMWTHLDLACREAPSVARAETLLRRTRGGLRSVRLDGLALACGAALQEAAANGQLAALSIHSVDKVVLPSRILQLVQTVGTAQLRRLHFGSALGTANAAVRDFLVGVIEQSPYLAHFGVDLPLDADQSFLPVSPSFPPLVKLETLDLTCFSSSLWAHLAGMGVKLLALTISSSALSLTGPPALLHHILPVISGPRLQHFAYQTERRRLPPLLESAVLEHPRHSLSIDCLYFVVDIPPSCIHRLQSLELVRFTQHVIEISLCRGRLPWLSHLRLENFAVPDPTVAHAILSAGATLRSLEIVGWHPDPLGIITQTLAAIAGLRELRCLVVINWTGVAYAAFGPLLLGEAPQCPALRDIVLILKDAEDGGSEFLGRVRAAMRERARSRDGMVNGEEVFVF